MLTEGDNVFSIPNSFKDLMRAIHNYIDISNYLCVQYIAIQGFVQPFSIK